MELNKYKKANVLVVGAGATGNESIKNLALSGIRKMTIVDMDHIVKSNMNRCIFFNDYQEKDDMMKAKVVSSKVRELDESIDVGYKVERIDDLGNDFIKQFDIVLGCVDNIQTRLFLNTNCYRFNLPFIDCGTMGFFGKIQVVLPPDTPCVECTINKSHEKVVEKRFSCTGKDIDVFEPKMPAEITTTAVISAIQVREALKILSGRTDLAVKNMVYYDGEKNTCDELVLSYSPTCPNHGGK